MSQSLSQLWIHIIFSTKNRFPFLDQSIQKRMHGYIKEICQKQKCYLHAIGGIEDHIHLLVSLHKNISLSKLIEEIKKSSSKWIKTVKYSNSTNNQFTWQAGYAAFSVSQSSLEATRSYIENQVAHHRKQNFQEELRKFLNSYGVTYKEEYLWD
ncbi:hypothetical protein AYO45_02180 [Gammaproteobacteria bacterium SCGC AG-212-F23]|nr:hypothetical protein AYO45_02180 [Gammaproteobacteria bacterium SCGC AG-212-F23]